MIEIKGIKKHYLDQMVLNNIDLTINKGEFVFLRGTSGSGKTTLLKILNREIEKYDGDITLNGENFKKIPRHIARRKVATIFQSFELLERKTALENIMLAGEVLGRPQQDIKKDALELLERVGLQDKGHRFPNELSGGEQQRVAIARALLNQPEFLLADEPTGNLDPETALSIMRLLTTINKEHGITMLIVTHSNELVEAFPSRLVTIQKGVIK